MIQNQKDVASADSTKTTGFYRRASYVSERKVGQTTYLVDKRRNTIHQMNPIGAAVWGLLDEPKDIEALAQILHAAFGNVRYGVIRRDVEKLISGLLKAELITRVSMQDDAPNPNIKH